MVLSPKASHIVYHVAHERRQWTSDKSAHNVSSRGRRKSLLL